MSKVFAISLRGQEVNNALIGTFKTRLGKINDTLTQWANAGACQFVIDGNPNWLKDLFSQDELRLMNGGLSARGREVKAYITAHAPINITEKEGDVTIALTKNRKNRGLFFDPMQKDDDGAPVKVDAATNPEWALDLRAFTNAMADSGKPEGKSKKAATLANQLTQMAALVAGEKEGVEVIGSAEELAALSQAALKVAEAAALASAQRPAEADDVDQEAAAMLAGTVSSAEKRAPQAVNH